MNTHPLVAARQLYKPYYTAIGGNVSMPPDMESVLLEDGELSIERIQAILDDYYEITAGTYLDDAKVTTGLTPLGGDLEMFTTPEKPGKPKKLAKALARAAGDSDQSTWTYEMAKAYFSERAKVDTEKLPEQTYSERCDAFQSFLISSWIEERRREA